MNSVVTKSSSDRDASCRQHEDDNQQSVKATQSEKEKRNKKDESWEESRPKETSPRSESEGVALPYNLIKALRRKSSSVIGSSSSHSNSGSDNNSDNSGLISIGNGSFGFNFDCEEGINSSGQTSEGEAKTNDSDSDGNGQPDTKPRLSSNKRKLISRKDSGGEKSETTMSGGSTSGTAVSSAPSGNSQGANSRGRGWKSSVSSLTQPSVSDGNGDNISHDDAAAAVVANLQSIANAYTSNGKGDEADLQARKEYAQIQSGVSSSMLSGGSKRSAHDSEDQDSGGYNSDGDESNVSSIQQGRSRKRPKKLDDNKREERNAREKERSFRISKQINELRNLLSSGGVIVPKGTKSSVLTEAANYIKMLQQHQYRSEIDRHQLMQQMQVIGAGALGPQASNAIRHVAAQNGVWSLGNFGGVPPKSAMTYYQQGAQGATPDVTPSESPDAPLSASVEEHEYRFVFNSSPVGMAIASMGGAFIDCNQLFCQLSDYSKQEICSMTIFNLTSRQDLQHAFDLISQMISPSDARQTNHKPKPCVLRGSMKERSDLGLSVSLIRGDDGVAKCFCVTLIKNPSSPFDTSRPTPATADLIIPTSIPSSKSGGLNASPAYTTG